MIKIDDNLYKNFTPLHWWSLSTFIKIQFIQTVFFLILFSSFMNTPLGKYPLCCFFSSVWRENVETKYCDVNLYEWHLVYSHSSPYETWNLKLGVNICAKPNLHSSFLSKIYFNFKIINHHHVAVFGGHSVCNAHIYLLVYSVHCSYTVYTARTYVTSGVSQNFLLSFMFCLCLL